MDYMPFKCLKCGNWYTPVPMPEDMMCKVCADGAHAVNPKTGAYDCHWGHVTATSSEVRIATLWHQAQETTRVLQEVAARIAGAKTLDAVVATLGSAEGVFATLERGMAAVPEILRWAGVKEMPGLKDAEGSRRFKSLDALEDLVKDNRRPQSDLAELKRSIKTCNILADELTGMVAAARVALSQVRRAAESWREPEVLVVAEPVAAPAAIAAKPKAQRRHRSPATVGALA